MDNETVTEDDYQANVTSGGPYDHLTPYGISANNPAALKLLKECIDTILLKPLPNDGQVYCNRTYDGLLCWDDTIVGATAYQPCPRYVPGYDPLDFAQKTCLSDGRWYEHPMSGRPWTNYKPCVDHTARAIDNVFIAGYVTSLIFTTLGFIIFQSFRQLKCARVRIHQNLFMAYMMSCILWLAYLRLVPVNIGVVKENPVWCQVLHVVTQYSVVCTFLWMFHEGFFLHSVLVWAFASGSKLLKICIVSGWTVPILFVLPYGLARGLSGDGVKNCWIGDSKYHWFLTVPITLLLLSNLVFLVNIVRILLSKLRATNREDNNMRRTVRATLILIPLLGLQYIMMPFKPDKGSPAEKPYLLVTAVIISFQGALVAMLFCFLNGEVTQLISKYIRSTRIGNLIMRSKNRRGAHSTGTDTYYMSSYSRSEAPRCDDVAASSLMDKSGEQYNTVDC